MMIRETVFRREERINGGGGGVEQVTLCETDITPSLKAEQ
jgi:hypothetical protein